MEGIAKILHFNVTFKLVDDGMVNLSIVPVQRTPFYSTSTLKYFKKLPFKTVWWLQQGDGDLERDD